MKDKRVIDRKGSTDVVSFEIAVGGEVLDYAKRIKYLSVTRGINRIPRAKIILLDGDVAKESFELSESDTFVPGALVEVKAGFNQKNKTIFRGLIVEHSIKMRKEQPSMLMLDCRDESFKLTLGRKRKFFYDSTDTEIIGEILSGYKLDNKVDETGYQHRHMVQAAVTDWDFILSRAEVNGLVLNVIDGKIHVVKPNSSADPDPSLVAGATVLEFEGEMDMRHQMGSVVTRSWDFANQEVTEAEGKDKVNNYGNISAEQLSENAGFNESSCYHTGNLKQEELQGWADASLVKSRLAKIRGRVRLKGYDKLYPDQTLSLEGLGSRFNGNAYVSGVRHELSDGNWHTDVELGVDPNWFVDEQEIHESRAAGLLPGIEGLQIGIVTQLQDDPDGEHRVRITLPMIDLNSEGIWARLALLDAGEKRGSFFYPEIGDEVVVGFLQGDPREGIVLGMLNSSAKPGPIDGSDDNHEKGFVTRSGMRVWFHDDDKSITIDTPKGNHVILSEAEESIKVGDQNNNKLELTASGIVMESPGNIQIKASGDVNIKGNNIDLSANAAMVAKGTKSAEFSSAGMNTVKGSMVQIN